jgi:hypothetical protein
LPASRSDAMPDDHARDLEGAAHAAAAEAGAIKPCPAHKDIFINQGDPDATRHAYALATVRWKAEGKEAVGDAHKELMAAVDDAINLAADECPKCVAIRGA